jgi:hypothetical protein
VQQSEQQPIRRAGADDIQGDASDHPPFHGNTSIIA